MVLEGLKRAEELITLLRRAGFQRPDKKALRPENFDTDFENRKHASSLQALLVGLQARILSDEEYHRYPW